MNKINSPPTTGTKKTTTYTKNLLFGFMLFELRMANNEKARRNIQKTRKLNCRVVISMSYNIKLSGAVAWGIMAKPPRVNASERPKGVVLSALL